MPEIKPDIETFASIKVIGVGGSGNSALNRMIQSKIRGVDFIALNTDVQALHHSLARKKIHIGQNTTRGLGAGMDPEMGLRAAEESVNDIKESLKGTDMVFITCGLGGGTGSGAGPKIAEIAKELGILTVGVVTKPFSFEGLERRQVADASYERMADAVDTIITIPNDRILQIIDRKTALLDAFEIADDVLRQGVQGLSELITVPGLINVDFADVRAIMSNRGSALMGIGRGQGETRAAEAAKSAIASPLLEVSVDGAKGILFTICGGSNLGMYEVSEAAKVITQSADPHAKVIFGAIIDESMKDEVKITVIATGFESRGMQPKAKTVVASGTYNPPTKSVPTAADTMDRVSFSPRATSPTPPPAAPVRDPAASAPRPSVAPAQKQPHIQPPQYAPTNPEKPQSPPPTASNKPADEEDLEIPAFIRKKMM
ncbi:cell division protein FtsZ [Candidatus Uhrbacteria bacterium]|nr:cell division protein FtsZ [Candidatus Uhrbacteria bacterium]MBD3284315.1 cell division protein FtsZ [Candidatus Uhrbacteria bacterium]